MTAMPEDIAPLQAQSQRVCLQLRQEIYQFVLLPGDRFTEADVARRLACSRTPVREALLLLQNERLVRRSPGHGWEVYPIDFESCEELYQIRELIEISTVRSLCHPQSPKVRREVIQELKAVWQGPGAGQTVTGSEIAARDEAFHIALTEAAGNRELTSILINITDRIRIMRRLDFEYEARILQTCREHMALLEAIENRDEALAMALIASHIADAFSGARTITLHRLLKIRAQAVS